MKRLFAFAALSLAGSMSAHAQLSASGGTPGIGISGYDGTPLTFTGSFNTADLDLADLSRLSFNALIDAGVGGTLEVTYLGTEANARNRFLVIGDLLVDTKVDTANFDAGTSVSVGPGAIDFSFVDVKSGTSVANGDAKTGAATSYVSFDNTDGFYVFFPDGDENNTRVFDFILAFNDGAADSDYDDLVVGINLTPIPEPSTYALMLAGLGVVGFMARRRRSA